MNRMIISLLAFLCCFSSNVWSVNSSREKGVMRVMSYNVRNCRGLDDQTDYKRIAKIISQADPDVISIQELDSVTTRNNGLFALGELAKLTRMHLVYAPAIDYQGGKYGIGILSKEKPLHTRTYSLPGREERRALLVVEFEKYLFCATHFTLTDEDQIASIPILLNALKGVTKPVFLAGDMNSEYFSATQRALREHFQMLNDPAKNTFPANAPDCCIDYIYALKSNATTFSVIRNEVLEEKVASDHRPLFTDIRMTSNCLNELKETARIRLNMNTDWAFYRGDVVNGQAVNLDDSKWIPIALPHVMQLEKKHCGGNGIYDGIGWYRRYFKLPESNKGKRIVVSFEGVMTSCEVYVNGAKVAENYGGYIGLNADITDMIKWGESNVLAVKVSAQYDPLTPPGKPQGSMDFYYYSGIYRDVEIIVTNKLHVTDALSENIVAGGGVFVTYPVVDNKE
ncbi:MAG: endonuclease/exonuclease/phosphatase family protein, partial [Bacteroidales bacterium]|nr:endonuclease/exonuclease/phosphatase family protein [Bacteroidales bacterium]